MFCGLVHICEENRHTEWAIAAAMAGNDSHDSITTALTPEVSV